MRGTSGETAAPEAFPIPLLPSGPGGVRGTSLHRARSSTLRQSRVSRNCRHKFNILRFARPFADAAEAEQVAPLNTQLRLRNQIKALVSPLSPAYREE